MKTKDLLTMATVALGTAALTVVTFWSNRIEAGSEGEVLAPAMTTQKWVSHGVEMTLAPEKGRGLKAGDAPVFELKAINRTNASASVCVRLVMSCSSPANPLSRTVTLPRVLWQDERLLTFKAGETQVVSFPTQTHLPANVEVLVSMGEGGPLAFGAVPANPSAGGVLRTVVPTQPDIVAMSFSTAVPGLQSFLVSDSGFPRIPTLSNY
jgi:hypothetical protein